MSRGPAIMILHLFTKKKKKKRLILHPPFSPDSWTSLNSAKSISSFKPQETTRVPQQKKKKKKKKT